MNLQALFVLSTAALSWAAVAAPPPTPIPAIQDGLVAVQSRDLDELYLRPNADLARYRKIMIDPVQVAFRDDWIKNMNTARGATRQIGPDDVWRIADETASSLASIIAEAFKARDYEIAAVPGPGVLRLSPVVTELYVNAPNDLSPGITKSYVRDAGDATMILEVRDAVTGTVLGRVVDHRKAREIGRLNRANGVTNRFWFDAMLRQWAANCVKEFEAFENPPRASAISPTAQ